MALAGDYRRQVQEPPMCSGVTRWCFGPWFRYLADHGGEVPAIEQWVLGIAHSGRVFRGLLIAEGPPL